MAYSENFFSLLRFLFFRNNWKIVRLFVIMLIVMKLFFDSKKMSERSIGIVKGMMRMTDLGESVCEFRDITTYLKGDGKK